MKHLISGLVFLFLGYLVSPLSINAQNVTQINRILQDFTEKINKANFGNNPSIPGNFFLNKEWSAGSVYLKNKQPIQNIKLRYFVYGKEIHIINNGDTIAFLPSNQLDSIRIDSAVFIYTTYINRNSSYKQDYFQKLTGTKLRLLKHYQCFFDKGNAVSAYEGPKPDKYTIRSSYFVQIAHLPARHLKVSKKEILNLFEDRKIEIQKFMKKERIKIKNEDDLKKLFRYYQQLP